MPQKTIWLMLCVTAFSTAPVVGDVFSLARWFDRAVALTNTPVVVTVNFTNDGTAVLRGFYYADQLPSALNPTTVSVMVNSQVVTNYTIESGQDGDVHPGCTPYRWVLERPKNFTETNPIPSHATAQIVYTLVSASSGTFFLPQSGWFGYDRSTSNAFFGLSQNTNQQAISFLTSFATAPPTLTITNNKVNLAFSTQPAVSYLVDYKNQLTDANWTTITNVTGSGMTVTWEDAPVLRPSRFYRIRLP